MSLSQALFPATTSLYQGATSMSEIRPKDWDADPRLEDPECCAKTFTDEHCRDPVGFLRDFGRGGDGSHKLTLNPYRKWAFWHRIALNSGSLSGLDRVSP